MTEVPLSKEITDWKKIKAESLYIINRNQLSQTKPIDLKSKSKKNKGNYRKVREIGAKHDNGSTLKKNK